MTAAPYDAGDVEQVRAAKGRASLAAKSRKADMAQVLATPSGRRVVWSLLGKCRLFQISHAPGDALQTAFHEGHRNVGNPLLTELMTHHSAAYAQMAAEAQDTPDDE